MAAFAWAAWLLRLRVQRLNSTMSWAEGEEWMAARPLTHPANLLPAPALLHYCFGTERAGLRWPESLRNPSELLEWEVQHRRPVFEMAHFRKWEVPGELLLSCGAPLLFQHPPLDYLLGRAGRWFTEAGKRWLFLYTKVATAVNDGVLAYRRIVCAGRAPAGDRVIHPWRAGEWRADSARGVHAVANGSDTPWRSAYEIVADPGAPGGFRHRPAAWAWWGGGHSSAASRGVRFMWRVSAASATVRADAADDGPFVALLSSGAAVDVVERHGAALRIVRPVMGWVPSAACQPVSYVRP